VELIKAYAEKDFDSVAKLQVKLHAEMVASLESSGALLFSFSKWDQPGGIEMILLTYKNQAVQKFLNILFNSDNILEILCFPKKEDMLKHFGDKDYVKKDYINKYYNSKELLKYIKDIMEMYLNKIIRTLYNKVKHSGLAIRDISVMGEKRPKKNTKIYIPAYNSEKKKIQIIYMSVVGAEAIRLADKYLKNIKIIVERMQKLSRNFAYFLENGLLLPSSKK